jgi:hypothetical protein
MNPTAKTPQRSPAKRMAGITQAQKQALMDNLQLESKRNTHTYVATNLH